MPNFDGGHYFLTTLAPIRVGHPEDGSGQPYVQNVQRALENLPTAHQSPATEKIAAHSPFAKSLRTHLCRFVVIEDAVYNGRAGDNPLLVSTKLREDPLAAKPVDRLPCAYLMFAVDFDAVRKPGDKLPDTLTAEQQDAIRDDYLRELWRDSSAELIEIYKNCQAFDAAAMRTPDDFAGYMKRCQIDTWMSFNDYYIDPPEIPPLPVYGIAAAAGLPAAAFLLFGLGWLFGFESILGASSGLAAIITLILTGLALFGVYRYVIAQGQKPLPAAPYGDLPSVLKGLYIQQNFADFVVANQGVSDTVLFKKFAKFLGDHRPEDVLIKTQSPGRINSK